MAWYGKHVMVNHLNYYLFSENKALKI